MATEVIMPQMGESIFEGTITKWLKQVGDSVQKDEPLFEISTDKVDAEIPSPAAGTLTEIKIAEGATVQINTVVGLIGAAGEAAAAPAKPAPAASEGKATAPTSKSAAGDGATEAATEKAKATAKPDAASKAAVPVEPPASTGATSGGTDVVMPQMGESIFEGTITKWLKQIGDTVNKDEPLFEISTDKVDAEIPAPVAGKLSEIKVPEGATVQINTVVAVIGGTTSAGVSAPAPVDTASPTPVSLGAVEPASEPASASTSGKLRSSPLVRRIAKDNNLDLAQIPGTGAGGRITKEDTLKFLASNGAGTTTPKAPTTAPGVSVVAAQPAAAAPVAATSSPLPGQLVPLTKMRSIIAQRMVESAHTSPHVHCLQGGHDAYR